MCQLSLLVEPLPNEVANDEDNNDDDASDDYPVHCSRKYRSQFGSAQKGRPGNRSKSGPSHTAQERPGTLLMSVVFWRTNLSGHIVFEHVSPCIRHPQYLQLSVIALAGRACRTAQADALVA